MADTTQTERVQRNDAGQSLGIESTGSTGTESVPHPPPTPKVLKNINAHGYPVLNVGNPGNKGGGRPLESVRLKLTGMMESHLDTWEEILLNLERLALEGFKAGKISQATDAAREGHRILKGIQEATVGSKTTNVVEDTELLKRALDCVREQVGQGMTIEAYEQVRDRLEHRLGG